jgi:GNAT superfamily N-acetyltransferase
MMSASDLGAWLGAGVTQQPLAYSGYRNLLAGADAHGLFGRPGHPAALVTKRSGASEARLTLSGDHRSSFDPEPVLEAVRWAEASGADTVLTGCAPEATRCLTGLGALGFTTVRTICSDEWVAKDELAASRSDAVAGSATTIDFGIPVGLDDAVRSVLACALSTIPELGGLPEAVGPWAEFSSSFGGYVVGSQNGLVQSVAKVYVDGGRAYHDLLYVRPEFRRHGLGFHVRKAICDYARNRDWSSLTSTYLASNTAVARINARLGYVRREETVYLVRDTRQTKSGSER